MKPSLHLYQELFYLANHSQSSYSLTFTEINSFLFILSSCCLNTSVTHHFLKYPGVITILSHLCILIFTIEGERSERNRMCEWSTLTQVIVWFLSDESWVFLFPSVSFQLHLRLFVLFFSLFSPESFVRHTIPLLFFITNVYV